MLLMLPLTCKDLAYINSLLLMYSNTSSLDVYTVCNMLFTHGIVKMATMYVERSMKWVKRGLEKENMTDLADTERN